MAVLENCFAKVLSKTKAYIPPSFLGMSYFPVATRLASQMPYHEIGLRPMLFSFSVAVDEALRDECGSAGRSLGLMPGVGGGSKVEDGSFGIGPASGPGCLKMPKLMDFLSGRMLHDIVCSALACTQRTRYDYTHQLH